MELQKICRICLKSDVLVSVFSSFSFIIRPIEMLIKLQMFKFPLDENVPTMVCQSCLYRLLDAYNLQQLAEASEQRLREYFALPTAATTTIGNLATLEFPMENLSTSDNQNNKDEAMHHDYSASIYNNICDMFMHSGDLANSRASDINVNLEVAGNDDVELLNEVEIDVSSLTQSEAGDDLNEISKIPSSLLPFTKSEHTSRSLLKLQKHSANNKTTTDQCLDCGKLFHSKGYLEIHKRLHATEKQYKCKICYREFLTSTKLLLHQRKHDSDEMIIHHETNATASNSNNRRYQCEICSVFCTTSSNLKTHQNIHIKERNYACLQCTMSFKSKRDLRRHTFKHNRTTKDVACSMCDKKFLKNSSLREHIKTVHSNIREHHCKDCNKSFSKKSNLTNHMRIHSGFRPFQCPNCPWNFTQSSTLMRHMMKKHSKENNLLPVEQQDSPQSKTLNNINYNSDCIINFSNPNN